MPLGKANTIDLGADQCPRGLVVGQHFDGPVVVEQDVAENAPETPLQLATRNFNYMQQIA